MCLEGTSSASGGVRSVFGECPQHAWVPITSTLSYPYTPFLETLFPSSILNARSYDLTG